MKQPSPFIPQDLPPKIDHSAYLQELVRARGKLGELNGAFRTIKNPQLISAPLITKEAVLSSQIEGTQATLEDVFRVEAINPESQTSEIEKDVKEVGNYREAIRIAIVDLKNYPVSSRLIRRLHEVLLNSVRGASKDRGNFRKIQVFIGKHGASIREASFVPPPANEIPRLMSNWEKYVHSGNEIDPLIMAGVAHYQFEAIHPFLDGNGRIGRILIPVLLYENGLLKYPSFFISKFFEENRPDYYRFLNNVSSHGDWVGWLRFFLRGILETSNDSCEMIDRIASLYERTLPISLSISPGFGLTIQDFLFDSPFISFMKVKRLLPGMNSQTIYNLLKKFEEKNILAEVTGQKRSKVYKFQPLLEILK